MARHIVRLNVGGKHYDTARMTLMSQDGSFFTALLGENFDASQSEDVDGRIFIDR